MFNSHIKLFSAFIIVTLPLVGGCTIHSGEKDQTESHKQALPSILNTSFDPQEPTFVEKNGRQTSWRESPSSRARAGKTFCRPWRLFTYDLKYSYGRMKSGESCGLPGLMGVKANFVALRQEYASIPFFLTALSQKELGNDDVGRRISLGVAPLVYQFGKIRIFAPNAELIMPRRHGEQRDGVVLELTARIHLSF